MIYSLFLSMIYIFFEKSWAVVEGNEVGTWVNDVY